MIVYGLARCDSCRKALAALAEDGHAPVLRDLRAEPLSEAEIAEFVAAFGPAIVNRRGTTWRSLPEALREAPPEALIRAHPAVMKRPVIRSERALTLGWDEGVRARHRAG